VTDLPTQIQAARLAYDKKPSPERKAEIERLEADYARELAQGHTETPGSFKRAAG
jgi:hypothetical protein